MYFQCTPTEKASDWSDDRIWAEFRARLETKDGWAPKEGEIFSKTVIGMRSLVVEPMRFGRLFLAGDSAHVVPPTGAKGLNLAASDAQILARAMIALLQEQPRRPPRSVFRDSAASHLEGNAVFVVDDVDAAHVPGRRRVPASLAGRGARLRHGSRAASTALAENYVGLPIE